MVDASNVRAHWSRMQFTVKRRLDFYNDMANAIAAGKPPIQAMTRLLDVSRPRRSQRWLVAILEPARVATTQGASFARALSDWVPPEDAALLAAGEEVGNLEGALRELCALLQNKLTVKSALMANLVPALTTLAVLAVLLVVIMLTIGKQAKDLVPESVMRTLDILPLYIAIGDFILHWGIGLVVAGVALVVAVWFSLSQWRPDKWRQMCDARVPPWSLVARTQTVFFLVSVSAMLRAGRTFRAAVERLQGFATPWSQAYMRQMLARLRSGMPEVVAMQVKMVPLDVADRLNFYADLPDFSRVMQEVARDAMDTLLRKVRAIGAVLKVLVMLLMVAFILFTLLSVYDMSDGIEKAAKQMMH